MARGKKKETLTPEARLLAALVPEGEQPYKVPGNWCWVRLLDTFYNCTDSKKKIPQKEYIHAGELAVVDQGQDLVGGYTNDSEIAFSGNLPVIIFGDHTRCIKYIDFPFAQGADGVKVLKPKQFFNVKAFYYAFQNVNIPNMGYRRHFPLFNQYAIPVPPLSEQQRIVDRIESLFAKLDEAKQKAQDALDSFETRKAAILHKAFTGELTAQWRKEHGVGMESWENLKFENIIEDGPQNGLYKPQTAYGTGTKILRIDCFYDGVVLPWENLKRLALTKNEIEQYHLNVNDIVINRVNSMAYLEKSALIRELPEECVFESNMMRITLNTRKVIPEYAIKYLNSVIGMQELRKNAKQAVNQASINQQDVKNATIKVPRLDEQAEIVCILDDLLAKEQQVKEAAERVLEQIDLIKKAILARAFRGELGTNDPGEESVVELLKVIM